MATGGHIGKIAKEGISDLVTCPLCMRYFQRPTLLPCGHSICQECQQVYTEKTLNNGTFLCPICRTFITLPNDGVDGFTHNFLNVRFQDEYNKVPVNRSCDPCSHTGAASVADTKCVECCEYLCDECAKAHKKMRMLRNHHIMWLGEHVSDAGETDQLANITSQCPIHTDEIVRYFCVPCQILICRDCKGLNHTYHKAVSFQEAIEGKREELARDMSTFQSKLSGISTVVDGIAQNISRLEDEKTSLIKYFGDERDKLILFITQAAKKTIERTETITSGEIEIQKTELERAQFMQAQIKNHLSHTNVLLSNGSEVEILHGYNLIKWRSSNLSSESLSVPDCRTPILQSTQNCSIIATQDNHFEAMDKANSTPDETIERLKTGRRLDSLKDLQTIQTPGIYVSGIALHDSNTVFFCTEGNLYRSDGNTYIDISPEYNTEGRAYDVYANNSTLVVSKNNEGQPAQLIVGAINTRRNITIALPFTSHGTAVVCGRPVNGQLTYYVKEYEFLCEPAVHHIDHTGNILQTYGKGDLRNPADIAVDVVGDLVVTDVSLNEVIIYNSEGSVKRRLREHNLLSEDLLSGPWGVCVDRDGYIFVSSHDTNSVLLFSPAGDYIRTVLTGDDGINHPLYLAVSQGGKLAVNLYLSRKIKVFTYIEYS